MIGMLQGEKASEQQQRAMAEILERERARKVEEEEEEWYDQQEEMLLEALKRLEHSDDMESIPKELREEFERDLREGRVKVEPWMPWWRTGKPQIQELKKEEERENTTAVPAFEKICEKESPLLAVFVLDIVFAYVCCCRVYNGEQREHSEAVRVMLDLSLVLTKKRGYETEVAQWIEGVSGRLMTQSKSLTLLQTVFDDVCAVVENERYLHRALRECYELLAQHSDDKRSEFAKRKVLYFLSWSQARQPNLYVLSHTIKRLRAI